MAQTIPFSRLDVRIRGFRSPFAQCFTGVSQESVLGPIFFTIYIYIYIYRSLHGSSAILAPHSSSTLTILAISKDNYAVLFNSYKSEALIIGTAQRTGTLLNTSAINVAGIWSKFPTRARFSASPSTVNSSLISMLFQSCLYHMRTLRHNRPSLTAPIASLSHSFTVVSTAPTSTLAEISGLNIFSL